MTTQTLPHDRCWDRYLVGGDKEVIIDLRERTADGKPFDAEVAATIAESVFLFLASRGCDSHFRQRSHAGELTVRWTDPLPFRVVARSRAAGSYLIRHPECRLGDLLDGTIVEFFLDPQTLGQPDGLQDDWKLWARYEPNCLLSSRGPLVSERGEVITSRIIADCAVRAREAFVPLRDAWTDQNIVLVDLGLDFGLIPREHSQPPESEVFLTGVLDHTSFRLWPDGDPRRETTFSPQAIADSVRRF